MFRESARKAKAQLQLKLVMDINSNKMFYHYISIKPPKKENMGDLLNGDCDSGTVGLGKAEVLHNFVTLSFAAMIARPQQSRDYLQERELSPVNKDQVRDLLRDLQPCKSTPPDEMLRELTDTIRRSLTITFVKPW